MAINTTTQSILEYFCCCSASIGLPKRSPKITIKATAANMHNRIINNTIIFIVPTSNVNTNWNEFTSTIKSILWHVQALLKLNLSSTEPKEKESFCSFLRSKLIIPTTVRSANVHQRKKWQFSEQFHQDLTSVLSF